MDASTPSIIQTPARLKQIYLLSGDDTMDMYMDKLLGDLPDLSPYSPKATEYINQVKLFHVKNKSCSRKNFTANLAKHLFTEETMKNSNVKGVLGKTQLDPFKLGFVKANAFNFYPLVESETEKTAWASCIRAIGERCRRLNSED